MYTNNVLIVIIIADGNVTRTNVADVEIFSNSSRFVFKENETTKMLWPGIAIYCHTCRDY